jgi:hypothetical protein
MPGPQPRPVGCAAWMKQAAQLCAVKHELAIAGRFVAQSEHPPASMQPTIGHAQTDALQRTS